MRNLKIFFILIYLSLFSFITFAQTEKETNQIEEPKNNYFPTLLVRGDDSWSELQKIIFDALHNTNEKQILADTLIKDEETAINVSEVILFKICGKDNIIKQRPYKINYVDGYWILNGTLSKEMKGGTFLIIINAKNGQVIKLTHGK